MREDGGLIGYGMATAVYGRACCGAHPRGATRRALRPGHVFQPGALIVPEITSIVRRPLTGRRRGSR